MSEGALAAYESRLLKILGPHLCAAHLGRLAWKYLPFERFVKLFLMLQGLAMDEFFRGPGRIIRELLKHPAHLSEALLAAAKNALLGKLNRREVT